MANTNYFSGALAAAAGALVTVGLLVLMLVEVQARPVGTTLTGQNGKIAYYAVDNESSGGIDSEIYTIVPTGGTPFNVTNNNTKDGAPSYSPDGKRIAYRGYDGNDFEIYTINARGGGGRFQVTYNTSGKDEFNPVYSPDGKKIAYTSSDGNDFEIYTINVGGGVSPELPTTIRWMTILLGGIARSGSSLRLIRRNSGGGTADEPVGPEVEPFEKSSPGPPM